MDLSQREGGMGLGRRNRIGQEQARKQLAIAPPAVLSFLVLACCSKYLRVGIEAQRATHGVLVGLQEPVPILEPWNLQQPASTLPTPPIKGPLQGPEWEHGSKGNSTST